MTKLVPVETQTAERMEREEDPAAPDVGKWYYVKTDVTVYDEDGSPIWDENGKAKQKKVPILACVTSMGSNYAEVTFVGRASERVHFDEFEATCEFIPDVRPILDARVREKQLAVNQLMDRVRELTMRLGVAPMQALQSGGETQALSLRNASTQGDVKGYEKALVAAKDNQLPELFKQIKEKSEQLKTWLSASLIPLEAQAEELKGSIAIIKQRLFHVELYAGLIETIVQISDGEPADPAEPIHLFQRRCYMDEESLAQYMAGGMCYQNVGEFHEWVARPENRSRLLPFPRCIVAFRIRRDAKWREMITVSDYFRIVEEEKADKQTFLYLRNGERVYCLATGIEFGEQLFPDIDRDDLDGKLWAKIGSRDHVEELISENRYEVEVKKAREERAEYERKEREFAALEKAREARIKAAKKRGEKPASEDAVEGNSRWHRERQYVGSEPYWTRDWLSDDWHPFEPNDVYYDDVKRHVKAQIDEHNRLVLVLQGVLDRSPVFHPHPPWQLWRPDGFQTALRLIYDDSKALTPGDAPDFEEYRRLLNASIKPGTVTVGQEGAWERAEAEKYNKKHEGDRHHRERYRYRPHENPGPGLLARVDKIRGGRPAYAWERHTTKAKKVWVPHKKRPNWGHYERNYDQMLPCKLVVAREDVFNVDAYTPGDFHLFFDDPRTRAQYLRWAPFLLVAEDYHAGVRTLDGRGKRPKPGRVYRFNDDGSSYETEQGSNEVAEGCKHGDEGEDPSLESDEDDDKPDDESEPDDGAESDDKPDESNDDDPDEQGDDEDRPSEEE